VLRVLFVARRFQFLGVLVAFDGLLSQESPLRVGVRLSAWEHGRSILSMVESVRLLKHSAPVQGNHMAMSKKAAGRLGGLKGGKARDRKLSKTRKVQIAGLGAKARWSKERQGKAKRRK
jgi:hypothetical protein